MTNWGGGISSPRVGSTFLGGLAIKYVVRKSVLPLLIVGECTYPVLLVVPVTLGQQSTALTFQLDCRPAFLQESSKFWEC